MSKEVKRTDTTPDIELPDNARFFCLIGKQDSLTGIHTFFHMGAFDETGAALPLLEIGKVGDMGTQYKDTVWNIFCRAAFSKTGAIIRNESHLLRADCNTNLSIDINYTAFEVTKVQYLFFLGLLKQINQQQIELLDHTLDKNLIEHDVETLEQMEFHRNRLNKALFPNGELSAYQPIEGTNTFTYRPISRWERQSNFPNGKQVINQSKSLSFFNTCRHTGLDLLSIVLGNIESSTLLSPNYLMPFPCHTTLNAGRYKIQLYLLPMPPNTLILAPNEKEIMQILYHRMERLLVHHYQHPATRSKFNLIKKIYTRLTKDKHSNINFLQALVEYGQQEKNRNIINQHRGFHWPFFHNTKTSDMFDEFEFRLLRNQSTSNNTVRGR